MSNEKLIELYRQTKNQIYANELYDKNVKFLYKLERDFNCDFDLCLIGFTKALNKFDVSKGKFTTLLYHVIKHECLMSARKTRIKMISLEEMTTDNLTLGDTIQSDFDLVGEFESKENVKKMLSILTKREQLFVIASVIEGYSYKEIANNYNLKPQTVANTISKALNKIRGNYEKIFSR